MKISLILAVCLALSPACARSAEPDRPIHEQAAPSTMAFTPTKQLKKYYSKTVNDYVKTESKKSGSFVVHDDVLKKDWNLKMVRVHTDRIVELGNNEFFACADLKDAGAKTPLDLDFYVKKDGDSWVMQKVLVHKVAGKPRYTYNDKNEMVPVQ